MVTGKRGISLVEMLIASALAAVVIIAGTGLLKSAQKTFSKEVELSSIKSAANNLTGHLQKYMSTGDLRFFGFTGTTDRDLARFLIPQPGKCADLSSCPDDTAFLYVHYSKTTTPTVSLACVLNSDEKMGKLLADLKNERYGAAQLLTDNSGFNVTPGGANANVGGKVAVAPDAILGVMNPPLVTLFVARASPATRTFSQPTPGVFTAPNGYANPVNPECVNNFQPASGGLPGRDISGIYEISVRPLFLKQFVAGSTYSVPAASELASLGSFPNRFFSTTIRSIGRDISDPKNPKLVIRDCVATGANLAQGPTLLCNGTKVLEVPDVQSFRIDMGYRIKLGSATASRFEIVGPGQSATAGCDAPGCTALPTAAANALPVFSVAGENFESLSDASFSLLKQEALAAIRFRFRNSKRSESFEVQLP